jgi:hypothetical protein
MLRSASYSAACFFLPWQPVVRSAALPPLRVRPGTGTASPRPNTAGDHRSPTPGIFERHHASQQPSEAAKEADEPTTSQPNLPVTPAHQLEPASHWQQARRDASLSRASRPSGRRRQDECEPSDLSRARIFTARAPAGTARAPWKRTTSAGAASGYDRTRGLVAGATPRARRRPGREALSATRALRVRCPDPIGLCLFLVTLSPRTNNFPVTL